MLRPHLRVRARRGAVQLTAVPGLPYFGAYRDFGAYRAMEKAGGELGSSYFDYPMEAQGAGRAPGDHRTADLILLPRWGNEQWSALIEYTETRRFRPGEIVVAVGEAERSLYVVASGALEVLLGKGRRGHRSIESLGPGSLIGEVSFFDGEPRSASVQAVTDGELLRLSFDSFEVFAARQPELARDLLLDLGRILAARLRTTLAFHST
jgi:CRP/FNR family cyclic AMP-dependent transcriptional regulator